MDLDLGGRPSLTTVALIDLVGDDGSRDVDGTATLDAAAMLQDLEEGDADRTVKLLLRAVADLFAGGDTLGMDLLVEVAGATAASVAVAADARLCLSNFGSACAERATADDGGDRVGLVAEAGVEMAAAADTTAAGVICGSIAGGGCGAATDRRGSGGVSPGTGGVSPGTGGVSPGGGNAWLGGHGGASVSGDGQPKPVITAAPARAGGRTSLPDTAVAAAVTDRLALMGSDRLGWSLVAFIAVWLLGLALVGLRRERLMTA